jgi:hypothetical protein
MQGPTCIQRILPDHLHRHLAAFLSLPESEFRTRPSSSMMCLWTRPLDRPIRNLVIFCAAWKLLLLLVAISSPSPGYDTSANLFSPNVEQGRLLPPALQHLVGKLTRWDAIYFVKTAQRGYAFEQEWAFGWGFTRLISLCVTGKRLLWSLTNL